MQTSDDDPVVIFARWKGYGDARGTEQPGQAHIYTMTTGTPVDLVAGAKVRLLAVYPTAYRLPEEAAKNESEHDVYDPHVVGRVTKRTDERSGEVVVTLENLCKENPVKRVEIRIPDRSTTARGGPECTKGVTGRAIVINMTQVLCMAERCWLGSKPESAFGQFRLAGAVDGRTVYAEKKRRKTADDVTMAIPVRRSKKIKYM